jgi:putative phosphoesterase
MKIAVLSDIHGNVPALEAVLEDIARWAPDRVIVNGDVVNRGPYSLRVLHQLKQCGLNCELLSGNHETFTRFAAENPLAPDDPGYDLRRFAQWTAAQLGAQVLEEISQWGNHVDLTDLEGGASFHVTHGSRRGNRDGISARTPEAALADKLGEPRDLFVASHTHKAMTRRYNGTLVVNTGSVGQPLDGDPRASYGRFTFQRGKWQADIARVCYDKEQAERDFIESGFVDGGGPLAELIMREHKENRMYVGPLMAQYHDAIKAGEITLREAIDAFLAGQ